MDKCICHPCLGSGTKIFCWAEDSCERCGGTGIIKCTDCGGTGERVTTSVRAHNFTTFMREAHAVEPAVFRGQNRDYNSVLPVIFRQDLQLDVRKMESLLTRCYLEIHDKIHDLKRGAEKGKPKEAVLGGLLAVSLYLAEDDFERERMMKELGQNDGDPKYAEELAFMSEYNRTQYSLSRLQHYGVPTSALDVTFDPGIALWFALHRMEMSGRRKCRYVRSEGTSVVYVMQVIGRRLGDLRKEHVIPLGGLRGFRQHGGLVLEASEKCPDLSEYVVKKIFVEVGLLDELVNEGSNLLEREYLFPPPSEDEFYAFLLDAKRSQEGDLGELAQWVFEFE